MSVSRCATCGGPLVCSKPEMPHCPSCQSAPAAAEPSPTAGARSLPWYGKVAVRALEVLYLLALLAFLPAFGFGVFLLVRYAAPDGWQPRSTRGDLQRQIDAVRQVSQPFIAAWERRNHEKILAFKRQTELLRQVQDKAAAERALTAALSEIKRQAVDNHHLQPQRDWVNQTSNANELADASAELQDELTAVAERFPDAFLAAVKKTRD